MSSLRLLLAASLLVVAGCPRQTDDHARGAASAAPAPAQVPPSDGEILPRDVAEPVAAPPPGDALLQPDSAIPLGRDAGTMDGAGKDGGPL
jgi:hypothetical protein